MTTRKRVFPKTVIVAGLIFLLMGQAGAYTPGTPPGVETLPAANMRENGATLWGRVNPNGDLTYYRFEWGESPFLGNYSGSREIGSGTSAIDLFETLTDLAPHTTYYFRVVASNNFGSLQGAISTFTTVSVNVEGGVPVGETRLASNISGTSATLNGRVNPNQAPTTYYFEYGTSPSFNTTTYSQSVGSESGDFPVAFAVATLTPNTTYYFRLIAQNRHGTSQGAVLSFMTSATFPSYPSSSAPFVETYASVNMTSIGATLRGGVNPRGSSVSVWFEYGTNSTALLATAPFAMGSGNALLVFSQEVSNLAPSVTYTVRAVARNAYGTAYGQFTSFITTSGIPAGRAPIVTTKPASIIATRSALFSGEVNPMGGVATAWFEYGPTTAFGRQSTAWNIGSGTLQAPYALAVVNLLPSTIYYFRGVAQNAAGIAYGETFNFSTLAEAVLSVPTPPAPSRLVARDNFPSCVTVGADLNGYEPARGDEVAYTFTYKNGCGVILSDVSLVVSLPDNFEFKSTSSPFEKRDGALVSYTLGVVPKGLEGTITIRGMVGSQASAGGALTFGAVFKFTDTGGTIHRLGAYVALIVRAPGSFFASTLETFRSLFGNWLVGTLLLIAVLALLFWVFRERRKHESGEELEFAKESEAEHR